MKIIKPVSMNQDSRGLFSCILSGTTNLYADMNYSETKKNCIRGNHYHKFTKELFLILYGAIHLVVEKLENDKVISMQEYEFGKFDIFEIEPYENHIITAKSDSAWISMLTNQFDENNMDFWQKNS